jgi:hypothetical protein
MELMGASWSAWRRRTAFFGLGDAEGRRHGGGEVLVLGEVGSRWWPVGDGRIVGGWREERRGRRWLEIGGYGDGGRDEDEVKLHTSSMYEYIRQDPCRARMCCTREHSATAHLHRQFLTSRSKYSVSILRGLISKAQLHGNHATFLLPLFLRPNIHPILTRTALTGQNLFTLLLPTYRMKVSFQT